MWSKVFGFLREMLTAFYFGAGVVKDAFNVSQAIPGRIGSAFFGAITAHWFLILFTLETRRVKKLSGRHTPAFTDG